MINGKKILAVVPARGGSRGVPKKNIKKLCGKPLICYTIETALASKYVDKIVVSSDSDEILDVVKKYAVDLISRPSELADDDVPMTDVINHALETSEEQFNENFDLILLLQPTCPFRSPEDINCSIEEIDSGDFDGVISVNRLLDGHPARIKKIENGILKPFCIEEQDIPRQNLKPEAYIRNGAIYLVKKNHFLKNKTVKEGRMKPYIMPLERSVNIDEPVDFEIAEFLLSKRKGLK